MPRRQIGQLGWADAAVARRAAQRRDKLSEIAALVDWQPFERLLGGIHAAPRGEASYPPLMMFKVLLLQRWYDLSDPAMEEALADRLSFRAFVGLTLADETPDHSTIWRFRERLAKDALIAPLMAEFGRQLDGRGAILKQGTLIDATLIHSAARRPRMTEGKISPVDPDARFGTNNERRRYMFGYKLHVAVDAGSGLVRAFATTPANVQEITLARDLTERGIADGIMRRNRPKHTLSAVEVARNHALSRRRRTVEKLFGTLKRSYRLDRVPYFNQARNATALALACFAFNLRRWHAIATP